MEKNRLAKGIEMVENEREIRDMLIARCEKHSEELYRIIKEAKKSLDGTIRDKELSRTARRELSKYIRHIEEMKKLADNLSEFNVLLMVTRAERADPIPTPQTK